MKKLMIISVLLLLLTIGVVSASNNTTADGDLSLKIADTQENVLEKTYDVQVDEYIEVLPCQNQVIEITDYPSDAKGNVSISIDGESRKLINENYQTWGDEYDEYWTFDASNLTLGLHNYELNFTSDSKYSPTTKTGTINITPMAIQFPSTVYIAGTRYTDTEDFGLRYDYSLIKIKYLKEIKGNLSLYINGAEKIINLSDYNASKTIDDRYGDFYYELIELDKSGEFYVYMEYYYFYTPTNLTAIYADDNITINKSGFVNVTYNLECGDEVRKGDDLVIYIPKSIASKVSIEIDGKSAKLYSKKVVLDYEYIIFYAETSSLGYGKHNIKITFKGDENCPSRSEYATFTVVHQPSVSPKTITVYYTDGPTRQLTVYGTDGKAVGANYETTVMVDRNWNTQKWIKTKKNGKITIKIPNNLKPGNHKLNVNIYDLDINVNVKLVIKHVVVLKKVAVKKSAKKLTLTATLKKGKTPLKSKQVTFKFNGKTYKARTNNKGIAKVTVPKSILSKLKAGKKVTYQATYLKDTVKKTVKVQK